MWDTSHRSERIDSRHLLAVAALILAVTLLHYGTLKTKVDYHTIYRELYLLPILWMSYRYGLRHGLITAGIVVMVYIPHVLMTWSAQPGVNVGNLFEIGVFLLVAATMGYLSDRENQRQRQMRKTESLASLGRASVAMAAEFQGLLKTLKEWLLKASIDREAEDHLNQVVARVAMLEQTVSQFSTEYLKHPREFVEIGTVARSVVDRYAPVASQKGVRLSIEGGEAECVVEINEADLVWVLEQLLKNALEHSAPGKTVSVAFKHEAGKCLIEVADQGRGIEPQNLSKVFVPFYTTKERGSGLGLAVCKKIMRDHRGDIQVSSQPGRGSTFTLVFPGAFA